MKSRLVDIDILLVITCKMCLIVQIGEYCLLYVPKREVHGIQSGHPQSFKYCGNQI